MDNILWNLIYLAGGLAMPLVPLVTALVGVLKHIAKGRLNDAYWPAISVGVGIILALFVGWYLAESLRLMAIAGTMAGLAASGLYSIGKVLDRSIPERKPHG